MINICIVHYNTPKLTECLIRSINKFTPDSHIYIFDNSDKSPFTYKQDNITYIDNTEGQIIDFDKWIEEFPKKSEESLKCNNYASAKHCYSIEKCMEIIDDNFILLDSDILLKKDISEIYDNNYIFVGEISHLKHPRKNIYWEPRVLPFILFINTIKCKEYGIHFFYEDKIRGIGEDNFFDTGSAFYLISKEYPYKEIKITDYITHFAQGSWNKNISASETWLLENKIFWEYQEKIIVTMTTWKNRIQNVPSVLNSVLNQTKMPDKIVINLSREEFPSDNSLPEEFINYIKEYDIIDINWIEGKNTRQWKKILPTFKKYPHDLIVCIDDDRIYPPDFIEYLYDCHLKHPFNPITVNISYKINGKTQHCGHGTMEKLEYYGDMLDIIDDEIYTKQSSDTFFTYMANRAGHPLISVETNINSRIKIFNEVDALHKTSGTYNRKTHMEMWYYLSEKFPYKDNESDEKYENKSLPVFTEGLSERHTVTLNNTKNDIIVPRGYKRERFSENLTVFLK